MVNSTAQPLTYAKQCSTTTSDPFAALLHMPDDIKEWVGVEEEATAFSARIPDSPPIYKGWSPSRVKPSHELTALDCMDSTFFKLANQLGGTGGLAAINFSTNPEGLGLKSACCASALACACSDVCFGWLHHARNSLVSLQ